MTKSRTQGYSDFYKNGGRGRPANLPASRGDGAPSRGVPTPVNTGSPAKPGAKTREGDRDENNVVRKLALKRRLAKTAKGMKAKSIKDRSKRAF